MVKPIHTPLPLQPSGRAFRHRFEGPFWRRVFLAGVRSMPQSVQRASMPMWAGIFYFLVPRARRIVEENLDRVCGPAPEHVRKTRAFRLFVHYAQSVTNMYAAYFGQPLPVVPDFYGDHHLRPFAEGRRGAIMLTGHLGYWHIAPFLMALHDWLPPITMAMAEEPNRALAEFEEQFRAKMRIVYTTSSPFALLELAATLRRGEFVGMQLDRHLGGAHALLPFCGRPAPFPLGPATLARATNCPLVPIFVTAEPDRHHCRVIVEEPIEVARTRDREADAREAMTRVVAVYERYVQRYPNQWFNFYDFWNAPTS
jgi:KDO2-lipid IV(A) lauroyltransferase